MAESIQAYYEKLIAQQSESIRKYLQKYGLTEWNKVAPTLTNKEREFILKRYREDSNLRASSFFRKLVVNAQLNETAQKNEVVKSGKKTTKKVRVEDTSKSYKQKTTKYRSIQEYYMYLVTKLTPSIRVFLRQNNLLKYENAFVWLEDSDLEVIMNGYTNGARLPANDLGSIFSKLCSNFSSHQPKSPLVSQLQHVSTQKEEFPNALQLDKPKLIYQETHVPALLLQQLVLEIPELTSPQEENLPLMSQFEDSTSFRQRVCDEREELFVQWVDRLPVWYIEVLIKNECTSFNKFIEEICKPTFSCKNIKHCGHNTVYELKSMAAVLIWLYSQFENNIEEPNETIRFLLSKLSNSDLSARAINCLESIDVKTIKDMLPLGHDVLLTMRNCGRKTVSEIEQFILSVKEKYCIPKMVTIEQVEKHLLRKQVLEKFLYKLPHSEEPESIHSEIVELFTQWRERISVRAKILLKENGFRSNNDFVEEISKSTFSFKNLYFCGQKSVDELGFLMFFLTPKIETFTKDPIVKYISKKDIEYAILFRNEYGHWPMMYILLSYMRSSLPLLEIVAFEENYGIIRLHNEIDELTKHLIKQFSNEVSKKVRVNPDFIQLCECEDWNLYCVNNIPTSVFDNEGEEDTWQRIEKMISIEKCSLNNYIRERVTSVEEYKNRTELLSHITLSTFKVLLQFWGHLPLWFDESNNCLVSYCPLKEKGIYNPNFPIVIDKRFVSFKFNKALAEIGRLQKKKTPNDILLSVEKVFVNNEDYWNKSLRASNALGLVSDGKNKHYRNKVVRCSSEDKASLVCVLKELFKGVCHAYIVDDNVLIKANTVDYSDKLYEILFNAGTRLHRDELFQLLKEACEKEGLRFSLLDSSQITSFLSKNSRIITYGKSSYWGLKEWGESYGSIRELAISFVKKSNVPIHIDDLTKLVMERRPDSNEKSISSIIRQTTATGELLLFFGDYIGHPRAKYGCDYLLMPRSFDEWIEAFRDFVLKNKRFPTAGLEYEGYLYRWYQRASQLTELSPDEILKIDALEKELEHYPHNMTEYNFLHNCNLYKKFVEGNNRAPRKEDDSDLYMWFYITSRNYSSYKDNRNKYFSQLLQFLSTKLY